MQATLIKGCIQSAIELLGKRDAIDVLDHRGYTVYSLRYIGDYPLGYDPMHLSMVTRGYAMHKFVKEVVTKELVPVKSGIGPGCIYMSMVPHEGNRTIELVIGASYDASCASHICKEDLQKLINTLQDIHDAMSYYDWSI